MPIVNDRHLQYRQFLNREAGVRHHHYDEEMLQYDLLKVGDLNAVEASVKMWRSGLPGRIVSDPVRNMQYLFTASATLATRFAIEGGMEAEIAYNLSDLYIEKADAAGTVEAILSIHRDMFTQFTERMARLHREQRYSRAVSIAIDYIHEHLHERMTTACLADIVGLNRSYFSTLFKRETGSSLSDYILHKRIETAEAMLKFSDFHLADIASILAFSSQSHFTYVFRQITGMTPAAYRTRYFRSAPLQSSTHYSPPE